MDLCGIIIYLLYCDNYIFGVTELGKIIAIVNQKGGVGKTTTAVNLASALGLAKKKVLLIDLDPQGNASSGLGINKKTAAFSSYNLLIGDEIGEGIIETEFKNVSVIPSTIDLVAAELELADEENREYILKTALEGLRSDYDYVLLDCPPSLGLITINSLTSSDSVLIPMQCEFFALEGLSQLMSTVRQVKRMYNENLELEGVLLTMFDKRLKLTTQVKDEIEKFLPGKVFKTVIPRAVRLSESPSYGMPIHYYDKFSKGARGYEALAKEIIKNNKMTKKEG